MVEVQLDMASESLYAVPQVCVSFSYTYILRIYLMFSDVHESVSPSQLTAVLDSEKDTLSVRVEQVTAGKK